ncbi:Lrp/AsnC family transcriptional regulator [Saccharopolyspora phatthalungensis]|uniref:DNA-binding Lrp family transcriptional regulator n=1 Tax=Saccharopolyspora phatthalungensis TaxID=664693 RepID=A0A840QJA3_9PSEU|nr:Lrp/AsnC family transcriptional regulator [Saccharopolyspora phatthalungensis]MBB5157763.1 DNA-binding Lrp family transcriptional regulator [Saccharopolyspora phatthalungensis]
MSIRIDSRRGRAGRSAPALDEVDARIVDELGRDGRMSIRTLAEQVNISRTNAHGRVERLIDSGVITGFHARVAPAKVGLGTAALIGLSIEQDTWREVAQRLAAIDYVEHVALVAGEFDIVVRVRTENNLSLRNLVFDQIQSLPGVRTCHTWLIFDEFEPEHR